MISSRSAIIRSRTEARIVDALAVMSAAGYSTAARQRALAPLRGLCRWWVRRGHLSTDPTADEDLAVRQRRQRLPSSFTDDEVARITAAAAREDPAQRTELRWPARDLATVALLAGRTSDEAIAQFRRDHGWPSLQLK